jgi:hypothetical protein
MATENTTVQIEPRFSAEAFGAKTAGVLNALLALEGCVSADTLRGGAVATESVPFVRPTGVSMYEADALTWRFYHIHANSVAHAMNNTAYGDALARTLFARLFERPDSGGGGAPPAVVGRRCARGHHDRSAAARAARYCVDVKK